MYQQTEGTSPTVWRHRGVFRDSGAGYKTAHLLTYLTVKLLLRGILDFTVPIMWLPNIPDFARSSSATRAGL